MIAANKPAPTLPINRHFDCMKRCQNGCTTVCQRVVYPQMEAALRAIVEKTFDVAVNGHLPGVAMLSKDEIGVIYETARLALGGRA